MPFFPSSEENGIPKANLTIGSCPNFGSQQKQFNISFERFHYIMCMLLFFMDKRQDKFTVAYFQYSHEGFLFPSVLTEKSSKVIDSLQTEMV